MSSGRQASAHDVRFAKFASDSHRSRVGTQSSLLLPSNRVSDVRTGCPTHVRLLNRSNKISVRNPAAYRLQEQHAPRHAHPEGLAAHLAGLVADVVVR